MAQMSDAPRADSCIHCGLPEADHHTYKPARRASPGCRCEARTWGDPTDIPPVCDAYEGDDDGYCSRCEYDQDCHAGGGAG